jgi:hypothetical protein
VDRVSRGTIYVPNLSVSILGGIQPAVLKDLRGLTNDGLLQRFIPVLMRGGRKDAAAGTATRPTTYGGLISSWATDGWRP